MSFDDRLGLKLRLAYLTFHRRAQAHFSPDGITADQFVMLSLLADEDGLTQRDLVKRSGSDSSTVGAMMQRLEQGGHIRRVRHERDGRALRVYLTSQGRTLQKRLLSKAYPLLKSLYEAVPPQSRKAVAEALEQVAQVMGDQQRISADVA